jgi:hypothetical protein
VDFSSCFRLPISPGARLARVRVVDDTTHSHEPQSENDSHALVDQINRDLLTNMSERLPPEAYILAFVSGSVVTNRLGRADSYWRRIVELFDLEKTAEELSVQYGKRLVDQTLSHINNTIISRLLCDRTLVGPAIFLFRIKKPAEHMFSLEHYGSIENFIESVSRLSQDCDERIRELFRNTDLGEAQPSVTKQLNRLLHRFGLDAIANQMLSSFDQFIQIQKETKCLHPALPIEKEAVGRTAEAFGIESDLSLRLITLFRFAWLCRLETSEDFSDLVPKSIAVIPQPETSIADAQRHTADIHMGAIGALQHTLRSQAGLQQFRASCPDVRVDIIAFVVSLPRLLFEVFLAVDVGEDRLTFLMKYQMGHAYFTKYIEDLLHDAHYGERIRALDRQYHHQLSTRLGSLLDRVVYLKIKIKGGNMVQKTIAPRDISPQKIRQWLRTAIERPDEKSLEKCSWIFNKIAKDDFAGNFIRGIWTDGRMAFVAKR